MVPYQKEKVTSKYATISAFSLGVLIKWQRSRLSIFEWKTSK
jgi:hypothetical protein